MITQQVAYCVNCGHSNKDHNSPGTMCISKDCDCKKWAFGWIMEDEQ